MTKKEVAKRYILFVISLFFSGVGVAFTKHGELGVSPISSLSNVMSYKFPELSIGTWLIIFNCILILGQILILRRRFQLIQLLQVPLSFLFGYFTDFGMWIASFIPVHNYPMQLFMVILGVIILGFGIALSVIADVIMNSGEAFVKAVADALNKEFSNVKIMFDVICVTLAVIMSLIFFDGQIKGAREGTVIAALCTGLVVRFFTNLLKNPLKFIIADKKPR